VTREQKKEMSREWQLVTAALVAVGVWLYLAHQLEETTTDSLRDEKRGERLHKTTRRSNLQLHDFFRAAQTRLAHVDLKTHSEYLCPLRVADAFLHRERGARPEHRVVCTFVVRRHWWICPAPTLVDLPEAVRHAASRESRRRRLGIVSRCWRRGRPCGAAPHPRLIHGPAVS
jgi:hypothetical protein